MYLAFVITPFFGKAYTMKHVIQPLSLLAVIAFLAQPSLASTLSNNEQALALNQGLQI
jgi:hypothetical protein